MKYGIYDIVLKYLNDIKEDDVRKRSIEMLNKLEEKEIYLNGKPSSITIAIIYLCSERNQIEIIRSFRKIYDLYATEVGVRGHMKKIGDGLGKEFRKRRWWQEKE